MAPNTECVEVLFYFGIFTKRTFASSIAICVYVMVDNRCPRISLRNILRI